MHFPGDYLGQLLIKLYECFGISSLLAYSFHFKHKIDVHVFLEATRKTNALPRGLL
jgi:hypothetical protein